MNSQKGLQILFNSLLAVKQPGIIRPFAGDGAADSS
jgi:hypothetical protein